MYVCNAVRVLHAYVYIYIRMCTHSLLQPYSEYIQVMIHFNCGTYTDIHIQIHSLDPNQSVEII